MDWKGIRNPALLAHLWPTLADGIKKRCFTWELCQKHKQVKVADRMPITPIPRDEKLPWTHLVMDCIGPIVGDGDPLATKPEYNYASVVVVKYTRYTIAYPVKTITSKAVCDCLPNNLMTYSIPVEVVSSDCGNNVTSQLTCEFLNRLGLCPRFNTAGIQNTELIRKRSNVIRHSNQTFRTIQITQLDSSCCSGQLKTFL